MTDNNTDTNLQQESNTQDGSLQFDISIDHFKMCLKEYLKVDDEIKTLTAVLRQKRERYDTLSKTLLLFLQKNNINEVQLEGDYEGKQLISQTQVKTKNASSNSVIDIVKNKLGNNTELLNTILSEVENIKEVDEVEKVKIAKTTSNKKVKSKVTNSETNQLLAQ